MKDVLELIVKNLVENKDEVSISETIDNDKVVFAIKVNQKDMGRIIGKEGKVANAIRTLMKSLGSTENKKVSVQFID